MKIKVLILTFFAMISVAFSEKTISDYKSVFGLKASNLTGYGIYYKFQLFDDFRVQLMGAPWYRLKQPKDNNGELFEYLNYDVGIELQQDIYSNETSRFYILAGAFYYYDDELNENQNSIPINFNHTINNSYNVGIGLSYEIMWNRIVFSFDLGYKYFEDHLEIEDPKGKKHPEQKSETKLGGGIGVGFCF